MGAINLSPGRILHLFLLIIASSCIALPLQYFLGFNRLGSIGLAVPLICQLNSLVLNLYPHLSATDAEDRKHTGGGKKKRRKQDST
jgi:hypothetical protein